MSFINQGKAGFIIGNVFKRSAMKGRNAFMDRRFTKQPGNPPQPPYPLDQVWLAAYFDRLTFELKQEVIGVGGENCIHTADIYSPDYLGKHYVFGENQPVWEGYRKGGNDFAQSNLLTDPVWIEQGSTVSDNGDGWWKLDWVSGGGFNIQQDLIYEGGDIIVACDVGETNHAGDVYFLVRNETKGVSLAPGFFITPDMRAANPDARFQYIQPISPTNADIGDIFKIYYYARHSDSVAGDWALFKCPQVIQGTGITVIPEYVETGVTPITKYFANENGNTVLDNVVTEGVGPVLNPLPWLKYQKATTNHFLNSAVPVTQNIAVDGQYTVWVLGAGSITLSGAATGVVTEGNPITFTATGTLTCTYAATLTHVQVENGPIQNGMIITEGSPLATDEILYSWSGDNHDDVGDAYEGDFFLSGENQVLLSMGGVDVLKVEEGFEANAILNGTFDADLSDWSVNQNGTNPIAWEAPGVCRIITAGDGMSSSIRQLPVLTAGSVVVKFDVVMTTGFLRFFWRGAQQGANITASGSYEFTVTAVSGVNEIRMYGMHNVACDFTLDNITAQQQSAVNKQITLSDGTNECSVPVVAAEPRVKAAYGDDGMILTVDAVTASCPYDGSLGAGVLSTKSTSRRLLRAGS